MLTGLNVKATQHNTMSLVACENVQCSIPGTPSVMEGGYIAVIVDQHTTAVRHLKGVFTCHLTEQSHQSSDAVICSNHHPTLAKY